MQRSNTGWAVWRGIALIAITYVYFLIFAQFAFLKRLTFLGIADSHLKAVMAAMAAGGILFSLIAPRLNRFPSPQLRLRIAFIFCGVAAFLSVLHLAFASSMAVSFLVGSGLGLLTVTLVSHLRVWVTGAHPLLSVGIGTGLGYFICNIPQFFSASELFQSLIAGSLCVVGILVTINSDNSLAQIPWLSGISLGERNQQGKFLRVLVCFLALVWLDSAAFFIIQNTPILKAGTWEGTVHLWANGFLHLAAAIAGVWLLASRGILRVLSLAVLALAFACLLLLDPSRAVIASVLYPIGVSLYSVALVAYPSFLATADSSQQRGRQAGWIYAIAGWCGSALGIGMGQNLGHVPILFVLLACVIVLWPWLLILFSQRMRECITTAVILLAALGVHRGIQSLNPERPQLSPAERGRRVYISEGCINCHSQYVRPNSVDTLLWGPVQTISELRHEQPPLIGNRRQGPDLSQVGSRRSPLWLTAHFYDPSQVSHASFMPSYAYLFKDSRGADLVAYMQSLQSVGLKQHTLAESAWQLPAFVVVRISVDDSPTDYERGERSFHAYCGTCHDETGNTRLKWSSEFKTLPPNLYVGPFPHLASIKSQRDLEDRLAHIVKFGIQGTDMPGHEYLPDEQIALISSWLEQRIAPKTLAQSQNITSGERQ